MQIDVTVTVCQNKPDTLNLFPRYLGMSRLKCFGDAPSGFAENFKSPLDS